MREKKICISIIEYINNMYIYVIYDMIPTAQHIEKACQCKCICDT